MFNKVKNYVADFLIRIVSNNKFLLTKLLSLNRDKLVEETLNYPSIVNNGFFHIEQVFTIANHFNLKNKKGIVVDVGAADGKISTMFMNYFSCSSIYSFEPVKTTFEELTSAVSGRKQIHIFNMGLAAQKGELVLNKSNRITSSSLFPIEKNIKDSYFSKNISKVGEEKIMLSTLDSEIPKEQPVHLIKLDVQGYELEVLKGGVNTLSRTSIVLIEMQNHDLYIGAPKYHTLDDYLRSINFTLYSIVPSLRRNLKIYEWDAIYVNNNLASLENN